MYNLTRIQTSNEEIQNIVVRCLVFSSHVKPSSCMREPVASFLAFLSLSIFSFLLHFTSSLLSTFHSSVAVLHEFSLFLHIRLFTYSSMYCNWRYLCTHDICTHIHAYIRKESLGTRFSFYNYTFIGSCILCALFLCPHVHSYVYAFTLFWIRIWRISHYTH